MARILLGWELGAGNGHIVPLLEIAAALAARGHEPLIAPQQISPFAAQWPTWQAPVWPRLLEALSRRDSRRPSTLGDSLAFLGLDMPEAITAMVMAWDRLLLDMKPDAVIAEYAPMLLAAAKGRVPVLASGNGFSLPPSDLPNFPSFFGGRPVFSERALLSTLNDCLRQTNREPLSALPRIFEADRNLVATFEELDPYRKLRRRPVAAPALSGNVPLSTGGGEEVFIYFNGGLTPPQGFWRGLEKSRLPIRIYNPHLTESDAPSLERGGIKVCRKPLPFEEIVAQSRLLISHGGLGFVSSGLLAGLPQVIFPFDAEKLLAARAIAGQGGCILGTFDNLDADAFSAFLRDAWADEALHTQAQASAPNFRTRITKRLGEEAADIVEEMI